MTNSRFYGGKVREPLKSGTGFTICGEDRGDSSSGGDEIEEVVLALAAT